MDQRLIAFEADTGQGAEAAGVVAVVAVAVLVAVVAAVEEAGSFDEGCSASAVGIEGGFDRFGEVEER